MIIILKSGTNVQGPEYEKINTYLKQFPDINVKLVELQGKTRTVREVHLIGPTHNVPEEVLTSMTGVERVIRVSNKYRQIGRYDLRLVPVGFTYQGIKFNQETLHVFPGPCAVDTLEHAEETFKFLQGMGIVTTRMGAYKPRTSPYDFQGHGANCLPWVFDLAGKYGIKIIAMEVLREQHIDEIREAMDTTGNPTGVMLQIGTRNAQNFELLKAVGSQNELPVLYKRGMGLTLEESLNACEYIASGGNRQIVFCLRGVKSHLGAPHRNIVDFIHVPVVQRLTRLPVCIDPSHSVGSKDHGPDGLFDIFNAAAQGVIAGANMILVECHPEPETALCDGPQSLTLPELEQFINDVSIVREAYEKRVNAYSQGMLKEMTKT
ncbi:MAG: 3-deoxy-7-phosphoheptulonate synthase [Deltaproteobacteria bacterium]|nr:MAG: 3-deoxy-7-phosphoheptulonate synthase [Deltaproteobacteria bacterium]